MPWAPAISAISAAATGSGSRALRASLRVAMWSILTAKRIEFRFCKVLLGSTRRTFSLAEILPHDAGDFGRPGLDLLLVLPLDHDPQERLGSRIAHEQASLAGQARFDTLHRCRDRRDFREHLLFANAHVDQHLR